MALAEVPSMTSVDTLIDDITEFGAHLATIDCSHASNRDLDRLTAAFGALESHMTVARSTVLAEVDRRGGDSIGIQKRHSKTSHSSAKHRTNTANALTQLPSVRKKMVAGKGMTSTKAELLGAAADKTSIRDVDGDETLLARIETQSDDEAKKTIDTWVRERQTDADRRIQRQRNIDNRTFVMFRKAGMIHTHGRLPATVENLRTFRRWETEKSRLWRLDGGRKTAHRSTRSDDQRGADAYTNIIDQIDGITGGLRDDADWSTNVEKRPPPMTAAAHDDRTSHSIDAVKARPAPAAPPRSQVVIVAQNETLDTNDPDVLADIIGGGPLLRSELDRHLCNADLYPQLFDPTTKNPLWEGRRVRTCTDAQWRALLIRDEGCVLTGADPSHCEVHHVDPYEAVVRGKTNIDNLVLVATSIHHWLHDNKQSMYRTPDGTWKTRPATPDEIAPQGRRSDE